MNEYLKPEDYREFAARFPSAQAFLRFRNIERELEHLEELAQSSAVPLNDWQMKRLAELREWRRAGFPIPRGKEDK